MGHIMAVKTTISGLVKGCAAYARGADLLPIFVTLVQISPFVQ